MNETTFNWQKVLQYGLVCGVTIIYVCLVGLVEAFKARDVIDKVLSLAHALLVVISFGMGYATARNLTAGQVGKTIISGLVVGLMGGLITAVFVLIMSSWNLRTMFTNASPNLIKILTFDQPSLTMGLLTMIGSLTAISTFGAITYLLPSKIREMMLAGFIAVFLVGMLQDFLTRIKAVNYLASFLYSRKGLTTPGALAILVGFAGLHLFWSTQGATIQQKFAEIPPAPKRFINWAILAVSLVILVLLPQMTDSYVAQILFTIGLYIIMGLGLNISLGWAGLLNLGFAGFFAIGAYSVALLTSTGQRSLTYLLTGLSGTSYVSFWVALPLVILASAGVGVFLGIPILRTRGDYLAIITLGMAEIIRVLVKSDALRPILGGAQGILNIPKPVLWLGNQQIVIKEPMHFYYLILIGAFLVAVLARRLQHARVGRNWMAIREDEDVAEAMGINVVATKLLAFGIGASFAGLSGAVFATQLGSVFPDSFGMLVSINAVSLVIIGGIGSIPGVIIGALVLVGLPELLREFAEFRLLIYGILLIVMMLIKPEGFWPSEAAKRELKSEVALA